MPKDRIVPTPATKPKALQGARSASKKSVGVPAPSPIPEFDAAAHRKEIAELAYRIWLERADRPGSPEEDWLKAESAVRAKYTR